MNETRAQDLQEPLLGGEDKETEPLDPVSAEEGDGGSVGLAASGDSGFDTTSMTEDALNSCLAALSKIGGFWNQLVEDRDGSTELNACLNYLHLWIQKGQFISICFAAVLVIFGGSLEFFAIVSWLTLLPLWTATVIFPLGTLYPDVQFWDLIPMVILMVILIHFGPEPDYHSPYAQHLLALCMVSSFCLPGTLCAKKLILTRTPQTKGRAHAMALGFALISLCPALLDDNDDETYWMVIISVQIEQVLIVAILLVLKDSPLRVTSLVTVMYPCLPFRSIKEMENKDHEAFQNQQEELEARLERQYARLGGKSAQQTSQQRRGFGGEIQYPIIMCVLVFWSLGFVLWYSQTTIQPLVAADKESHPMHTTTIYPNVVSLDENSFKNALEQYQEHLRM